jgi:hypothetical protein
MRQREASHGEARLVFLEFVDWVFAGDFPLANILPGDSPRGFWQAQQGSGFAVCA